MWAENDLDSSAMTPSRGWCKRHGVFDCPLDHPEVAQIPKPPAVTPADEERVRRAFVVRTRLENDPSCEWLPRRVRFASQEAVEKAGIDIAPVWQTAMTEVITASGEVTFDRTQVARLSARVPGTAWRVMKKVGDPVRAGEVLALIDAAEVGKIKAEFQQALVQLKLKRQAFASLKDAPVSAQKQREAEAAMRVAEIQLNSAEQALVNLGLPIRATDLQGLALDAVAARLQRLGLPDELMRSLDSASTPGTLLPIRAPFDGTLLASDVIAGEVVDTTKVLFVLANPRRMWLTLHVPPDDARWLTIGQQVRFRPDGGTREFSSKLAWIGTTADERTRTVPVRAELADDEGRLRAFTFGLGKVVLREEPNAVVVPSEAVQSGGGCRFVFVRDKDFLKPDGPKVFHTRTVRVGAREGSNTEIIVGVLPGEIVATKGSALLLNEILKNRPAQVTTTRR
jgi:cobalt-zinc-cadmium efflux system membrane fusion protein